MKKINTLLFLVAVTLFFNFSKIRAQGNTCATATPFCTAVGTPFSYPNDYSGSTGQTGPSYGCVLTQPDPGWFYIKALTTGTMNFTISQTSGDVDFVAWGPFTAATFTNACNTLTGGCSGDHNCSGGIADCSYSTAATENMTLNAIAGQYFIVMVTNFVGTAGTITMTENSGPPSDCSITCPTLTVSATSSTICNGASTTLSVSGGSAGMTYTWTTSAGTISSGVGTSLAVTPTVTTTYTVTGSKVGCTTAPVALTITVKPTPTLTPVASQTVCGGSAVAGVTFASTPAGSTFSWTNSNAAIGLAASGSGNIAGYTAPNVASQQIGTITVTPTLTGCVGTAGTFTITINPKPTITAVASQTVCGGSAVAGLTFASTPAGSTFGWTNSNAAIGLAASGSGNIAGYTAPNVAAQQIGTITVTPTLTGCAGTAGTFSITINPKPVLTAVTSQTVCGGSAVAGVTFASTPAGSTFGWTNSNAAIGLAASGSGNIAGYTAPNVASQQIGTITVTPTLTGCAGTAGTFSITINPTPTITAVASQTVCGGSAVAGVTFASTPAGSTFGWTNSNAAIGLAVSGSGNIAGYTAPNVAAQQIGTITVTPTLGSCVGTAGTFSITINPKPVLTAVTSQTVCGGSAVAGVTFASTPAGSTFGWTNSNASIGLAVSGSGNIAGYTAPNVASQQVGTITVTPTLGSCVGTAGTFSITINPKPVLTAVTSQTVCGGSAVAGVSFASTPAGSTFGWTNSNASIGLAVSGSGNIAGYTAPNVASQQVGTITVTPTLTGCAGTAGTFSITINPTPTIAAVASQTVCGGSAVAGVTFASTPAGSTFGWTNSNASIGLAVSGSGNIAGYTAPNVASQQVGTITVTPTLTGCAGTAGTFSITINPTPSFTLSANSYTICNGNSQGLVVSGASTYTWTPAATLTGANTSNPTATPTTTTVYSVTGTSASACANLTPATVTVTVNPKPTYALVGNAYTICNGGSQTFTVSGASTYTWTPSATLTNLNTANPTANPTTTTVYSVTGTSAAGCGNLTPATVTVTVSPIPALSLAANSYTICNGATKTFTVSGASTYTWTPAATLTGASTANPVASPTTTTIYTVAGTASGCAPSSPLTLTLTVNPLPTYSLAANSYTICNGATQGLSVSGASTYTWAPASSLTNPNTATPTAQPTTTTVYSVTGTSASACSNLVPATVTVTVNPLPTYSLAANSYTICNGATQGLSVSGASTYTWTPAASLTNPNTANPTAHPTTTTVYSVTGTNTTTCSNLVPATVTVTVNPLPTYSLAANSYTICNGGSQTFSVSGASTYTWTPAATLSGANTANPTANPSSTTVYSVTGTNTTTCSNLIPATVTLTVNALPTISVVPSTTAICSGAGSSTLTASGGSTYTWTPNATLSSPTGSVVTATPTNTATPTVYTVNSTDINGCKNNTTISITVNQTPTVTVSGGGGNSQTVCSGDPIAGITFSVSPSSANVSWTNNNTNIGLAASNNGNIAGYTSPSVTVTTTGLITATATTTTGQCPSTNSTQLNYTININPLPGVNTPSVLPAGCGLSNGAITGATGIYGPGPYTYEWNNTGGFVASSSLTDSAGTYNLQIKDGTTGCVYSQNFTLPNAGAPSSPTITLGAQSACVGSSSVFNISLPQATYIYDWTEANGTTGTGSSYTVTNVPTSPNPYFITVTATNSLNCTGSATTATLTILPLPSPSISNSTGGQICNGSSTTLSVTPNSGGYTYQWSNSGGNIAGATADTLLVSAAGAYSVTVTNTATTCSATASANGAIIVNSLPIIDASTATVTPSNCSSPTGAITNVTYTVNGTGIYVWTDNATGTVVGGNTPTLSNVPAGNYCVQVTDVNTCVNKFCSIAVSNAGAPAQPVLTASLQDTIYCNGSAPNTLTVTVTNSGTVTPTVNWYDASNVILATNTNTYTPTSLPIGTTTLYVTATANGCSSINKPVTITVLPTPTITIASLGSNSVICNGASVTINPTGASSYTLNPGNLTGTSFTVSPNTNTTYTISGSSGTTGCTNSNSNSGLASITVNATPTISISPLGSNSVICNGASVTINPTGATSYTLNPGNLSGTSFTVSPSASTTYTISGTDATTNCSNANSDIGLASITVNATPTISISPLGSNSVICNGGSVTINPTGATSYTLNPGNLTGTSFTVSPSASTTYTISGTDATSNCTNSTSDVGLASVIVSATPTIGISPLGTNSVICSGASVTINPTGATSYTLNPGNQTGTSFTVNPSTTTTYSIDGSNGASGCPNLASGESVFTVTVNPTPIVDVSTATTATAQCGQATGGVSGITNVISGTPGFTYQWIDATGSVISNSLTLSGVQAGNYTLVVTDSKGCIANSSATGSVPTFSVPSSSALVATFNTTPSLTTGTIPLSIIFTNTSNVPAGSTYDWNFGDGSVDSTGINSSHTYTAVGTYTATLTISDGPCQSAPKSIIITAQIPTTLTIPNIFTPNGDGINDEFFIVNTGMSSLNCEIFSRWGQLLHTLTAPNQSWDGMTPNGDKAPEGTYMYILEAQGLDGKTYKQQGTLMLNR